jgi:hypothetical protein
MSTPAKSDKHGNYFQAFVPGKSHKITVTGTSQQTSAFQSTTSIVRVFVEQDAWIRTGENPTAAANDGDAMFMPGGMFDYIGVNAGDKLAIIFDSVGGDAHITEGL